MKRTEQELEDLLLEAIERKQIYTIRKITKELKKVRKENNDTESQRK